MKVADPIPDIQKVIPTAGCRWFIANERGAVCTLADIRKTVRKEGFAAVSSWEYASVQLLSGEVRVRTEVRKGFALEVELSA